MFIGFFIYQKLRHMPNIHILLSDRFSFLHFKYLFAQLENVQSINIIVLSTSFCHCEQCTIILGSTLWTGAPLVLVRWRSDHWMPIPKGCSRFNQEVIHIVETCGHLEPKIPPDIRFILHRIHVHQKSCRYKNLVPVMSPDIKKRNRSHVKQARKWNNSFPLMYFRGFDYFHLFGSCVHMTKDGITPNSYNNTEAEYGAVG